MSKQQLNDQFLQIDRAVLKLMTECAELYNMINESKNDVDNKDKIFSINNNLIFLLDQVELLQKNCILFEESVQTVLGELKC